MAENKKLEQNKKEEPMTLLSRSLLTGFIGGIFWSMIGLFMYYFNFIDLSPKFYLLTSWLDARWTDGWLGDIITILLAGVVSLLISFIYYGLFKKVNSMWMGVAFGAILWVILFYLLQPIFTNVPNLSNLHENTIIATFCLFILYGTFIGYSISYDYHDTKMKEA